MHAKERVQALVEQVRELLKLVDNLVAENTQLKVKLEALTGRSVGERVGATTEVRA